MASTLPAPTITAPQGQESLRRQASRWLPRAMEALVLMLVCLSPWAFGAIHPFTQYLLYTGLALLLLLWAARILVERRFTWKKCPVALGLAGLFLFGIVQLVPLPHEMLRMLSPATVRWNDQLLPAQPEVLPTGAARDAVSPAAGSTLTLYPAGTRAALLQLLAVFLLFAVVRNNLASPAALWRLSVAAVINGALLALLGLVQFYTSAPEVIYWVYRSPSNAGFGPFVNRNRFAFYLNLCLGLGVGLLLAQRWTQPARWGTRTAARPPGPATGTRSRHHRSQHPVNWDSPGDAFGISLDFLQTPAVLWTGGALVLMLFALTICQSRGGVVALLTATLLCVVLVVARSRRPAFLWGVALLLVLALVLLSWFGWGAAGTRLETLWTGKVLDDPRGPLWAQLLPVVEEFPVWGTGYGTFPLVEPWHRGPQNPAQDLVTHAHNEYLEALVEGGLVRLALSLLIVGLVFRLAYRAFRRHEGQPIGGLVLGALFAFTTVVVYSFVEFGLHTPAVALLATVLCAQLCGQCRPESAVRTAPPPDPERSTPGLPGLGLAPLTAAAALAVLALLLWSEGWKPARAEQLRLTARGLQDSTDNGARERQIGALQEAVATTPADAPLRVELAEAHLQSFKEGMADVRVRSGAVRAATTLAATGPLGGSLVDPLLPAVVAQSAGDAWTAERERQLVQERLLPALRAYLEARDQCPLLSVPQVRLADYAGHLEQADSRLAYLRRAALLRPSDAEVWYARGVEELKEGHPEEAQTSWRQSLRCAPTHFTDILDHARPLGPEVVSEQILPDEPELLLRAALYLYPDESDAAARRPFLEKAERLSPTGDADNLHRKAVIQRSLGEGAAAVSTYREALLQKPHEVAWRWELAELLYREGRLDEAREQLQFLLAERPEDARALRLLQDVGRKKRSGIE